jgi:hypothetical protein
MNMEYRVFITNFGFVYNVYPCLPKYKGMLNVQVSTIPGEFEVLCILPATQAIEAIHKHFQEQLVIERLKKLEDV